MLPNSNIFRSRWKAILWAIGICWFAIEVAGSQGAFPGAHTGDSSVDSVVANLIG
jgi:hypothetical protein